MSSLPPKSSRPRHTRPASSRPVGAGRASTPRSRSRPRPGSGWRRWALRLGVVGLFAAAAGATFVLFAVVGLQVGLRFREVDVPDLAALTVDEATAALRDAGLGLRIDPLTRIDATIPASHVADQDPAAGVTTRSDRTVKVWLSSGQSAGSVPSLIGQSERGARARLQEDGLGLSGIAEIHSGRYPSDSVVAQEPPSQGAAPSVSVLINRGERGATYIMPDLIGMQGVRAAEVLRARGFRVTETGDHPYPDVPPGIVLRQGPLPGFQIAHGEAISLEVSR